MDIFLLKNLKKQFLLSENPTDKNSIENKVALKLLGILGNRPNQIPVPQKDFVGFVLYFICECDAQEWEKLKCPYSLLSPKQVAPSNRRYIDEFAILGEDVALVASSLMHWYGNIEVFDVLRREWAFNLQESRLERKGLSSLLID